jgi:integrase
VKFEEIARDFLVDYEINDRKSIDKAIRGVRHLQKSFGNMKVRDITTDKINLFIQGRRDDDVSNAEINQETAALKRMFNLAIRAEKVFSKPYIPKLTEDNVRTGFFENPAFRAVLKELPEPIKPVALFGYYTSWRREEIVKLTWAQIDLDRGTARLEVGTTKNKEGRLVYFPDELHEVIRDQRAKTSDLERIQGRIIPWVFHRDGEPIKDFREAWNNACRRAGCTGRYFHDLRRTGIRNMIRKGISEPVAMKVSGHKMADVFRRYNIVVEDDLRDGGRKMSVIVSGIVDRNQGKLGERQ